MEFILLLLTPIIFVLLMKPTISLQLFNTASNTLKDLFSKIHYFAPINALSKKKTIIPSLDESPETPKVKEDPLDFTIYFGSQTGTSEMFAAELSMDVQSLGYKTRVVDLFDFKKEMLLSDKLAIFLVATYGDGDPTVGSEPFFEWLTGLKDGSEFPNLDYAVFGLGNSQYEQFNLMGKSVFKKLKELGARPLCDLALGDDDADIESDFKKWENDFITCLKSKIPRKANAKKDAALKSKRSFELIYTGEDASTPLQTPPDALQKKYVSSKVKCTENKAESADGLKWHVEFDISGCELLLDYEPASTLCVFPRNDYRLADRFCKRFKWDKRQSFVLEPNTKQLDQHLEVFSAPMTIERTLLWYLDLTRMPKKALFNSLLEFIEDAEERELARRFADCKDQAEFLELKERHFEDFSVLTVFQKFKSLHLSFESFIAITPRLQSREYTISSSSKITPHSVSITYSLVDENGRGDLGGAGVCTNYLKSLQTGKDLVAVHLKKSTLVLPDSLASIPILLVGAGSGIAPFRSFVLEATHAISNETELGRWSLFFGCRHPDNDYLYKSELCAETANKKGVLTDLIVAFSRKEKHKVYVQHLIEENHEMVWRHLCHPNSRIFVCGSAAMGREVKGAFKKVAAMKMGGEGAINKAMELIKRLRSEKRLVSELWG